MSEKEQLIILERNSIKKILLFVSIILGFCSHIFSQEKGIIFPGKIILDTSFSKSNYLIFDSIINPIYDSKNDVEFRLYSNYKYKSYRGVFVLAKEDTLWSIRVLYQEGKNTDFLIEPRMPSHGYKKFIDSLVLSDAFGLPDWSQLDCKVVVYDLDKEAFDTVKISFNNPWDFKVEFKIENSFGFYAFQLPRIAENDIKHKDCAILKKYESIIRLFSNLE